MKEKPIIFSTKMVEKILSGQKSKTRRVVKYQPPGDGYKLSRIVSTTGNKNKENKLHWIKTDASGYRVVDSTKQYFSQPYGYVGDILWVRETWANYQILHPRRSPDGRSWSEFSDGCAAYKADGIYDINELRKNIKAMSGVEIEEVFIKNDHWIPAIHMPRWACRIRLKINTVKVERLQDIDDIDALAEGFASIDDVRAYWDKLNEKRGYSWESNPWVWAIGFERI